MGGNRSLDEFAGDSGGEGAERTGDAGAAETVDEEGPVAEPATESEPADGSPDDPERADDGAGGPTGDHEGFDPPASTYVWRPGGGPCAGCGATVEERWRDGDDLVCAGCKEW